MLIINISACEHADSRLTSRFPTVFYISDKTLSLPVKLLHGSSRITYFLKSKPCEQNASFSSKFNTEYLDVGFRATPTAITQINTDWTRWRTWSMDDLLCKKNGWQLCFSFRSVFLALSFSQKHNYYQPALLAIIFSPYNLTIKSKRYIADYS